MTRYYAGKAYADRGYAEYRFVMAIPVPFAEQPSNWIVAPRPDDWAARQWVKRDPEQDRRNIDRRAEFNAKAKLWAM